MQNYEQAVGYIKNFLSENHYGQTLVKANERCFRTFGAYLNQEGTIIRRQRQMSGFIHMKANCPLRT